MGDDIVVVGSLNMDYVVNSSRIPKPGETLKGMKFEKFRGGKGANQAVAVRKLGENVTFICARGNDKEGRKYEKYLNDLGINTKVKVSEKKTGSAHIVVTENGESHIIIIPGANNSLSPRDIEDYSSCLTSAKMILVQMEIPSNSVEKVLKLANKESIVILDPAPAKNVTDEIISKVDYILPNEEELKQLTSKEKDVEEIERANLLQKKGANNVILTKGSKGIDIFQSGNRIQSIDAPEVNVVDATGAGDAFAGAFSVGLNRDLDIVNAAKLGIRYASDSVKFKGAQNSYSFNEEISNLNHYCK